MQRARSAALPLTTILLLLAAFAGPRAARAGSLSVSVTDSDGNGVKDAVVFAVPVSHDGRRPSAVKTAAIDQIDKEYVPYVTAVRAGTEINFPNRDQIRHHVYSFSPAKTFEIPLYKGTPPSPILFDKPGVVVLGCNIHDWMKAYVFVTDTPYFAVTDKNGKATVAGVPARDYRVEVWHPRLKGDPSSTAQEISVGGGVASASFAIAEKRVWRPRRAPSADADAY